LGISPVSIPLGFVSGSLRNFDCGESNAKFGAQELDTCWRSHSALDVPIWRRANANIGQFASALGYRSPQEFERQAQCQSAAADSKGATITFVAGLAQSSTGMLEQGTQTPSHAPDLIPAVEISETAS
jgi:hypothetical protein